MLFCHSCICMSFQESTGNPLGQGQPSPDLVENYRKESNQTLDIVKINEKQSLQRWEKIILHKRFSAGFGFLIRGGSPIFNFWMCMPKWLQSCPPQPFLPMLRSCTPSFLAPHLRTLIVNRPFLKMIFEYMLKTGLYEWFPLIVSN